MEVSFSVCILKFIVVVNFIFLKIIISYSGIKYHFYDTVVSVFAYSSKRLNSILLWVGPAI